mmetsp:Transcript_4836/g.30759  ORF Transcript_4836/g.30759 Transcript_4836/m.30759 type:complete len:84 (+) Transcript_4836:2689-2940(+)
MFWMSISLLIGKAGEGLSARGEKRMPLLFVEVFVHRTSVFKVPLKVNILTGPCLLSNRSSCPITEQKVLPVYSKEAVMPDVSQ